MNQRFRQAATGAFRLTLTVGQQRALASIRENTCKSWPPETGVLVARGLLQRYGDTLTVTVAGLHAIGLLEEAGLYEEAKAGEPATGAAVDEQLV